MLACGLPIAPNEIELLDGRGDEIEGLWVGDDRDARPEVVHPPVVVAAVDEHCASQSFASGVDAEENVEIHW